MDFPIQDLMDEDACYQFLLNLYHPAGLCCPRCHAADGFYTHPSFREPVLDYRCSRCGQVFRRLDRDHLPGHPVAALENRPDPPRFHPEGADGPTGSRARL
jgi:Transposase zinc-ribbon domain